MPEISKTATDMIANMTPELRVGRFIFVTIDEPDLAQSLSAEAISIFREDEGISMILPVDLAEKHRLNTDHNMACITLTVYSSLEGVGLTSAVASALGQHNIPCNMVAAFHHDHVFVPFDMCDQAMEVLTSLQNQTAKVS